jgi:hypothetical protein
LAENAENTGIQSRDLIVRSGFYMVRVRFLPAFLPKAKPASVPPQRQ